MGLSEFLKSFLDRPSLPAELHPFTESSVSATDEEQPQSRIEDFAVEIGSVSGEKAYLIEEEQNRLIIDPQRGDWEESREKLKEVWVEKNRVFTESAFDLYISMEANKQDIEDVCEFFEPPVLQPKQHRMLEEAYHVSTYFAEFDVSYDEEQRRRRQLGDKFDDLAMNLPSLCSAGYLDEGGLFRDMYREFEPDHEAYQELFDKFVKYRPFVVFVRGNTAASEIYDLIIQKSRHLDDIGSEFDNVHIPGIIHVRGIGPTTREKIMSGQKILRERHSDVTCLLIKSDQSLQSDETLMIVNSETL